MELSMEAPVAAAVAVETPQSGGSFSLKACLFVFSVHLRPRASPRQYLLSGRSQSLQAFRCESELLVSKLLCRVEGGDAVTEPRTVFFLLF